MWCYGTILCSWLIVLCVIAKGTILLFSSFLFSQSIDWKVFIEGVTECFEQKHTITSNRAVCEIFHLSIYLKHLRLQPRYDRCSANLFLFIEQWTANLHWTATLCFLSQFPMVFSFFCSRACFTPTFTMCTLMQHNITGLCMLDVCELRICILACFNLAGRNGEFQPSSLIWMAQNFLGFWQSSCSSK